MGVGRPLRKSQVSRAVAERLVKKHLGMVRPCLNTWLKGRPVSAWREKGDLYAEGVFALWRSAMLFDAKRKTKFNTFAFPRVVGAFADYARKNIAKGYRRAETRTAADAPLVFTASPETMELRARGRVDLRLFSLENREQMRLRLAALAPRQRECFVMHYGQSMSLREIAAVTGLHVGSVSMSLGKARKKLAEISRGAPLG